MKTYKIEGVKKCLRNLQFWCIVVSKILPRTNSYTHARLIEKFFVPLVVVANISSSPIFVLEK
jgi:hypothetical protein